MLRAALRVIGVIVALGATAWGALVLHFTGPAGAADALAVAWVAVALGALVLVRPLARGLVAFSAAFLVVLLWWGSLRPSNDRDWIPDVARLPQAEVQGDRLTIRNVRNFDYRSETDWTPRWEERTYDLSRLVGADLFMSYWSSPLIAHTIVSWEFADAPPLAISIETRKERGEEYSAVKGFFRQYELYYVVADERDVIRLRTNYRGEQVYLYRIRLPVERARAVLLDYVAGFNALAEHPKFYNALTHNCTTGIRVHTMQVGAAAPWNWRVLVNGYADRALYEQGRVDTSLPFEVFKERSLVNDRARAADQDPDFSHRIREGLPDPR